MRYFPIIMVTASLAMLPACATMRDMVSDPTVVQANSTGITYRYHEGLLADAKRMAKNHCDNNGRSSKLDRVDPGEDNNRTATFLCV